MALAIVAAPSIAVAELPPPSRLTWTNRGGSYQSLTLEFAAVAVLGANRLTGFPEVGKLGGGEPEMIRLRIGNSGDFGVAGYAVRFDIAETLRITEDQLRFYPLASVSQVIDDLFGLWRPVPGFEITAGRQRVGASRFRSVEVADLPLATPPFVIDRVMPDRRWGARARLARGRLIAGLGAWIDTDEIEPRIAPNDPSFGDGGLGSAELGIAIAGDAAALWLPARRVRPAPELDDPKLEEPPPPPELHAGVRLSGLVRAGDQTRADAALGGELRYDRYGGLLELLLLDGRHPGAAAEAEVALHPNFATFIRGELDTERDQWASGAGISWYPTEDRRSRIALYAWLRRELDPAPARDGVILQLGAAL